MKYRKLGAEELRVSEIGLGAWQIGSDCWGDVDEKTAMAIMETAVASGVSFFDTADVYGKGLSETRIGKFLKSRRDGVFVATKIGRFPEPGGRANFTFDCLREHTQASLKRLGMESLDLTQLHCIPAEVLQRGEVFDWLRRLKEEGLIRRFGASVESMEEALLCLEQEGLASLQIIFNLFRQKPISALFERAKAKNVALIVRLPLASGLLSGRMTAQTVFPENDHRGFNRDGQQFNVGETFAGLPFATGVRLAGELASMVPNGMTLAQMALRWILDFGAPTVVIPGAKSPGQALANASASGWPALSPDLHRLIGEFYETRVAGHIRGPY